MNEEARARIRLECLELALGEAKTDVLSLAREYADFVLDRRPLGRSSDLDDTAEVGRKIKACLDAYREQTEGLSQQ